MYSFEQTIIGLIPKSIVTDLLALDKKSFEWLLSYMYTKMKILKRIILRAVKTFKRKKVGHFLVLLRLDIPVTNQSVMSGWTLSKTYALIGNSAYLFIFFWWWLGGGGEWK